MFDGGQFSVQLYLDDDGYFGRECPECERYFKLVPGTGIPDEDQTYCPYCGHRSSYNRFWTKGQLEYTESLLAKYVIDEFHEMSKDLEREFPKYKARGKLVGFYVEAGPKPNVPIQYYKDQELETLVTCSNCTLQYAVYGVFGYCPDCGQHNSLQILGASLDVITKMLELADAEEDRTITEQLIEGLLSNVVGKFDGFGRELCRVFAERSSKPTQAASIRFQNLTGTQRNVQEYFGFDIAESLTSDEWEAAVRCFQKRHLFEHKFSVIDDEYIKKANDPSAVEGRKVKVSADEVTELISIVRKMSAHIVNEMDKLPTVDKDGEE